MSAPRLYYIITEGPVLDAIDRMNSLHKEMITKRKDLHERFGADGAVGSNSGCAGLTFSGDNKPPKNWTKKQSCGHTCWLPGKKVEGWKALREEIAAIRVVDAQTLQQEITGRSDPFRFMHQGRAHFMGYEKIGEYRILSVPDIAKMMDGETLDSEEDAGIFHSKPWEPLDGCRHIKTSEYWALKEAHESVRK